MSTTKTFFVIFFIIILSNGLQSRPEIDWFDSVNMRLRDSQEVHTAVIVHDHHTRDSDAVKDEIFGKIIKSMPTVTVEMKNGGIDLIQSDAGVVSKLSTCLLFVYYAGYPRDNKRIDHVMKSINKLADFSLNYLLIILRTSSASTRDIRKILQNAWTKSIPNIMIVEIRLVLTFNGFKQVFARNPMFIYCKDKKCERAHIKIYKENSSQVMIHQFNPFIEKFYHEEFSPKMELFPKFAENMHMHPLSVAYDNQSHFLTYKNVYDHESVKVKGPDSLLMQIISKKLNFTSNFKSQPSVFKKNMTVENIIRKMKDFRLDIFGSIDKRRTDEIIEQSIRSRNIQTVEMGVLMPRRVRIKNEYLNKAVESGGFTLIIIMIVWFAVILLKFDGKIWQLCNIFGLIFMIVVPHQPSRNYERILFLFVAMLGFMYSNDIYASLTDLGVDNLVEKKYETIKDIEDSGFRAFSTDNRILEQIRNSVEPELHWMKENLLSSDLTKCPTMAKQSHNVACVTRNIPRMWRQFSFPNLEEIRFAKPILWTEDMSFRLRQGLPGREKINQVIGRCEEAGILGKLYYTLKGSLGHNINADDKDKLEGTKQNHLLTQLIVVAVFGHSLASLVLIGELLIHRFGNLFKKRGKEMLWSMYKKKKMEITVACKQSLARFDYSREFLSFYLMTCRLPWRVNRRVPVDTLPNTNVK